MMDSLQHAVILVYSTSHALRLESLLKAAGISCKLIPVPRHLSSDCGVCVRIERNNVTSAEKIVETGQLEIEGIHNI
jgi:hypothetical protein